MGWTKNEKCLFDDVGARDFRHCYLRKYLKKELARCRHFFAFIKSQWYNRRSQVIYVEQKRELEAHILESNINSRKMESCRETPDQKNGQQLVALNHFSLFPPLGDVLVRAAPLARLASPPLSRTTLRSGHRFPGHPSVQGVPLCTPPPFPKTPKSYRGEPSVWRNTHRCRNKRHPFRPSFPYCCLIGKYRRGRHDSCSTRGSTGTKPGKF